MAAIPEALVQATRYEVSIFPEGAQPRRHFTITIEWRSDDRWAVLDGHYCLGSDGEWEYEPQPSNRDDAWIDTHRFDLDTAKRLAKQAAPYLIVNGHTALEIYRRTQPALVHVGGNAEDCPACKGTNPDYPFICPGPEATA